VAIGLLHGGPTPLLVTVALVWGFGAVADSAQFSAAVTEVVDQQYVGTALTMQQGVGFTITVVTTWLLPLSLETLGWRWAFTLLGLGPLVGIGAMLRLRSLPEAIRIAGGRR
jgi:MFS family permease